MTDLMPPLHGTAEDDGLYRALADAEQRAITAAQREDFAQFTLETVRRRADAAEEVLRAVLIEHWIDPGRDLPEGVAESIAESLRQDLDDGLDVGHVPDQARILRDAEGTELGTATLCGGKEKPKVTDEAALLAWVQENRPDQVRQVVEPAYVKALLKQAEREGAAADETTGEVIPGIEFVESGAYVTVKPNDLAKDRMAELIAESGLLGLTRARRVAAELPPPPVVAFEGLDAEEDSPW